jgi:mRNA interferase MazF
MSGGYVPERGDIIFTDFDPSAGHEQAHHRPALVLTLRVFNDAIGLALVAPITTTVRNNGMEVLIDTDATKGAILCQQIKMIDFDARGASYTEKAPDEVLNTVLRKIRVLVA